MSNGSRLIGCWALALISAAALRLWGLVTGSLQWHADEFYLVCVPLKLLSGTLNSGQNLTAFYPGFHYDRLDLNPCLCSMGLYLCRCR
jgi:hypothetical protein